MEKTDQMRKWLLSMNEFSLLGTHIEMDMQDWHRLNDIFFCLSGRVKHTCILLGDTLSMETTINIKNRKSIRIFTSCDHACIVQIDFLIYWNTFPLSLVHSWKKYTWSPWFHVFVRLSCCNSWKDNWLISANSIEC